MKAIKYLVAAALMMGLSMPAMAQDVNYKDMLKSIEANIKSGNTTSKDFDKSLKEYQKEFKKDPKALVALGRQERQIEFYLENHNFWDLRRWKLAEKYFSVKAEGFNIEARDINSFATVSTIMFERKFESPTQYLLPIPLSDVNKNLNLVQNPGY